MPYFYRNYWNPNRWYFRRRQRRWPRRRPYLRRIRKTLRKRWRIQRRRRRVRYKKLYKKKLPFLYVKEYQPKTIQKCKIKGAMCLFQGGPDRLHYNYTQYINSITPEFWEGGGGWSQLKFTLGSLYEQNEYLKNKWTKSNVALPLCRYTGCTFKFWRQYDYDYIVYYSTCLPMLDTLYQHINAQPYNMLLYKNKIIVRSLKATKRGKPYKKIRIKPPEQYRNSWYFQADFQDQGLVLLTSTAADFTRMYLNPRSISSSITLHCLNPELFHSHNFKQSGMGTALWTPTNNLYYYTTDQRAHIPAIISDLVYCGQTTTRTLGKPFGTETSTNYLKTGSWKNNFANIFMPEITTGELPLYVSELDPKTILDQTQTSGRNTQVLQYTYNNKKITLSTKPIFITCRYNPDKDKGDTNKAYFLTVDKNTESWEPTGDPDLETEGYPFWCLLWGYEDWVKKLKKLQHMGTDYILILRSDIIQPKLQQYVIIDHTYIEGHSPYQEHYTATDYNDWNPCLNKQMESIDTICKTGPLTCKTYNTSIEAHCTYCFYFKWGGCPNQLENIKDPTSQPHYPTPHNFSLRPETADPATPPEHYLYPWDIRRLTITKKAAYRMAKDIETKLLSPTDSRFNAETETVQTQQEDHQTQTPEETETPPEQQLQLLQHHRRQLQHRLIKLISQTPTIKFT
nr:MAG: ORF1 [TTV-like mini virus]